MRLRMLTCVCVVCVCVCVVVLMGEGTRRQRSSVNILRQAAFKWEHRVSISAHTLCISASPCPPPHTRSTVRPSTAPTAERLFLMRLSRERVCVCVCVHVCRGGSSYRVFQPPTVERPPPFFPLSGRSPERGGKKEGMGGGGAKTQTTSTRQKRTHAGIRAKQKMGGGNEFNSRRL
jgi:hypothetical protein